MHIGQWCPLSNMHSRPGEVVVRVTSWLTYQLTFKSELLRRLFECMASASIINKVIHLMTQSVCSEQLFIMYENKEYCIYDSYVYIRGGMFQLLRCNILNACW